MHVNPGAITGGASRRPDDRDSHTVRHGPRPPQTPAALHEIAHGVAAGEEQPVGLRGVGYQAIQRLVAARWADLDGGHVHDLEPQHLEPVHQVFRGVLRTRHYDARLAGHGVPPCNARTT